MSNPASPMPAWQQAIREKCRHPSGQFHRFLPGDIEQSIAARFVEMAKRYSDRQAVIDDHEQLTYDALNRRGNLMAHAILDRQGPCEGQVALLLEHGVQATVALIGALKAGKCYVPLDASCPRDRAAWILDNSQTSIIVTDEANLSNARDLAGDTVKVLLAPGRDSHGQDDNPRLAIPATRPAYIFYTSGSTGVPKGVVQSQRVILHMMMAVINLLHVCPEDRLALLEPFGFSGAVLPYFGALLAGGCLCLLDVRKEGFSGLAQWLEKRRATIYFSVPTLFRHFTQSLADGRRLDDIRAVWLTGEVVRAEDAALYQQHLSDNCVFVNGYGATETTSMTQNLLDKMTEASGPTVPVGWPIDDVDVLILDDQGRPAGPGEAGEIAVRGRYFAEGYWRNPDLTRQAFQSDPQGDEKRIYRTGDFGRIREDGCLLSLGRRDSQVKIRGYRVDIGEIESALRGLGEIAEAVVTARASATGEAYLVAYVVTRGSTRPTVTTVRRFLADKIPDYMIPSAFVFLDALPLLPASGKLNRAALPEPEPTRPSLDVDFVAPRSPFEETLADLWSEVLGIREVGVCDNFFDLGGHSLKAAQMVARVSQVFGVELPISVVFAKPTVAGLAEAILAERLAAESGGDTESAPP